MATGGLKPPLETVTAHQREMGEWNAPLFSASFFFIIIFILKSRLAGGKNEADRTDEEEEDGRERR